MKPALKMSEIDREHLQELYDSAGMHRDLLPYTPQFDELCQGFQDRTFKNAEPEQVFAAIIKSVRTGNTTAGEPPATDLSPEQVKQLKGLLPKYARGGKLLPYSDEFESARKDFNQQAGTQLGDGEFWVAMLHAQGPKRRPPVPRARAAKKTEAPEEDEGE